MAQGPLALSAEGSQACSLPAQHPLSHGSHAQGSLHPGSDWGPVGNTRKGRRSRRRPELGPWAWQLLSENLVGEADELILSSQRVS